MKYKRTQSCWSLMFAATTVVGLVGCASVSVSTIARDHSLAPKAVEQVTISPFTSLGGSDPHTTQYLDVQTGHISWGTKRERPQVTKLGQKAAESLKRYLERHGILAQITHLKPKEGLWVSGQLTKEVGGSRALRTIIGLGAGKTQLDSKILIYNLDKSEKKPWVLAHTSGGSNREPGAIFSAMPSPIPIFNIVAIAGTAVSLATHGQKGLTQDASRTGRAVGALIRFEIAKAQESQPKVRPKFLGWVNHPLEGQHIRIPFSRYSGYNETHVLGMSKP